MCTVLRKIAAEKCCKTIIGALKNRMHIRNKNNLKVICFETAFLEEHVTSCNSPVIFHVIVLPLEISSR